MTRHDKTVQTETTLHGVDDLFRPFAAGAIIAIGVGDSGTRSVAGNQLLVEFVDITSRTKAHGQRDDTYREHRLRYRHLSRNAEGTFTVQDRIIGTRNHHPRWHGNEVLLVAPSLRSLNASVRANQRKQTRS